MSMSKLKNLVRAIAFVLARVYLERATYTGGLPLAKLDQSVELIAGRVSKETLRKALGWLVRCGLLNKIISSKGLASYQLSNKISALPAIGIDVVEGLTLACLVSLKTKSTGVQVSAIRQLARKWWSGRGFKNSLWKSVQRLTSKPKPKVFLKGQSRNCSDVDQWFLRLAT